MDLMDVFTHFSIIRRERRGIRPEEIKLQRVVQMILVLMELPPRLYTSVLNKKSAGLLGYFTFFLSAFQAFSTYPT
jgi:hypothetical protein